VAILGIGALAPIPNVPRQLARENIKAAPHKYTIAKNGEK